MKYILLDTETSGLNINPHTKEITNHKVVQLGYMVLDKKEVIKQEALSKPIDENGNLIEIEIKAMATHNITNEMVVDKPILENTSEFKFLEELNNNDNVMIIHNSKFDLDMLQRHGYNNNMKLIDTLKVAMSVYPDLDSHSLQELRYSLGLYKTEQDESKKLGIELKAHDAMGDILFMKLLLTNLKLKLVEVNNDNYNYNVLDDMIEITSNPILIQKFKFGKHFGKTVEEVCKEDYGYCKWLIDNNDDEDLIYTVKYHLENIYNKK